MPFTLSATDLSMTPSHLQEPARLLPVFGDYDVDGASSSALDLLGNVITALI